MPHPALAVSEHVTVQVLEAKRSAVEAMAGTYQKWHGMMRESDGTERLPIMRHPPVRALLQLASAVAAV